MEFVANIGCPDVLLTSSSRHDWLLCPISADASDWLDEYGDLQGNNYQDGTYSLHSFSDAVRLFDGLTDSGLIVR